MKHFTSADRISHAFNLVFAENNPKFLVVGTFPTAKTNITFNFFYSSGRNDFWKVLSKVFPNSKTKLQVSVSVNDSKEVKAQNKLDRENFCRENSIALTDMISTCIRLDNNSKDTQLLIHKYNDVIAVLRKHKSIQKIILTSKSKGSSAQHHFYQYLVMNEIDFDFERGEQVSKGKIEVEGRTLNVVALDSTSSQNRHVSEKQLIDLYKEAFEVK